MLFDSIVVWKGCTLRIGEKTQGALSRKLYGIAIAVILCLLAVCIIHPIITKAKADVVFLRTTFPILPVMQIDAAEEPDDSSLDVMDTEDEDTEYRLVSMLMKDDAQVVYEKMPDDDKERWQVVRMRVTGYCSCPKCCGKFSDGRTASNHRINKGDVFVAADKFYRFGTDMIIPGYNNAHPVQVKDRGRVIKGNRLDLYFDTHRQAQKWGVKYLDVLVKIGE
jgi:3D (Asp-Asp-Asp) domain-containing protein